MKHSVYVVYDPVTDVLTNFFTSKIEAEKWTNNTERMGSKIIGPYSVTTDTTTPYEIVIETEHSDITQINDIYWEEQLSNHNVSSNRLLGPYSVCESVDEYLKAVAEME